MEERIQQSGGGLKCDNPKCDFYDETVPFAELDKWLNVPCPKCGENLLTQEDYDNAKKVLEVVNFVNSLTEEQIEMLNVKLPKGVDANAILRLSVETHKEIKITGVKIENKP